MASKVAHQSLNDQQNEEDRILIDRKKKEIQKEINQAKLSLKDHQDANLKLKKRHRQKNPQIAQLEKRLSKLNADMKEIEHAISEKGSTTNSAEVEQKPLQDSGNETGTLQEVSSSAPEETHQSESENSVSKDENVIKPLCRKCKDRSILLEKLNARYEERKRIIKGSWKDQLK